MMNSMVMTAMTPSTAIPGTITLRRRGDDFIHAGEGDNRIYGGDGIDQIQAGAGNDYIEGGAGADSIVAGDGDNMDLRQ